MSRKDSRHLLIAVVVGATGLALAGCGSSGEAASLSGSKAQNTQITSDYDPAIRDLLPKKTLDSGTLRVGVTTTNPPFSLKQDQELVGVVPELAAELEGLTGVNVDFVETAFPGLVPALQADRIDVIWTLLTDTVEREEALNIVPYMRISSSLLVPKDNPESLQTLDDLCGANVANLRGAIHIGYLEEQSQKCIGDGKPEIRVSLYDDSGQAQTQLRAGKVDAYFGFRAPLQYVAAKVDDGNAFTVLDGKYKGGYLGLAVPKEQVELAEALRAALTATVESGAYTDILERHNVDDEALSADEITVNGITSGVLK